MYASDNKYLEISTKGEKGRQMLETMKERAMTAHRRRGDEGFTLIELLVVIVILAILAAIVVFAVGGLNQKGQAEACKTDMKSIQTAEEAYFAKQSPGGVYASADELKAKGFITNLPTLHTITAPVGLPGSGNETGPAYTVAHTTTCNDATGIDDYQSPN
jgi:general secretion pathway protein G